MSKFFHIVFLLCALLCLSCSRQKLHEAQSVVAAADSLRIAGQPYTDSTQLAQAYTTLKHWQTTRPDDYARACYYYGRLLRAAEHYPEAMTCFINATHSRSTDYRLLGRVYSNMGSLCHLAEEFKLSYDMYALSTDIFLSAGDTTAYYYGIYRMAFEKAEMADSVACMSLIREIEHVPELYELSLMTQAELYLKCHQFDSALVFADRLALINSHNTVGLLIKAQAFSFLQLHDSATFYANIVMAESNKLFDIHNALYILTNDDESKDKNAIRQAAADRADVQKILKIRQGKLSQAVQLLELDLNRKPDRRWLYAVAITICVIGLLLALYVRRKSRQRQLLSQQVAELENSNNMAEQRHNQLVQMHTDYTENLKLQIEQKCLAMTQSETFLKDICWKDYHNMCVIVNHNFGMLAAKLQKTNLLSEQEIRLCVLILFNCNRAEIAEYLPYSITGVGKFKYRVAQKLGTEGKILRNYLISLVTDEPQNETEMKLPTSQNNYLPDNQ